MELANWLQSVASRRWPILPDTRREMNRLLSSPPDLINYGDLANLALSDPFLLLDVLRTVAASEALQQNESLPSVESMLIMTGMDSVLRRYRSLEVLEPIPGKLDPEVVEAIGDWLGRSRVAAWLLKEWLSIENEVRIEDAFMAALVYNLPACLFLIYRNHLPREPLLQAVSHAFDTDYPRLLEQFIRRVPLPSGLLPLLGVSGTGKRRQLFKLAIATANGIDLGWWRSQWQVGIEMAAKLMEVGYQEAYQSVTQACLQVVQHSRAPGYGFAARALIRLEGEYVLPPEQSTVEVLSEAEQLDRMIRDAFRKLANDLKFERILFWRYESASHCLKLRFQIGLEDGHPLRRMPVELEPGSFFHLLTSKAQCFHAPDHIKAQLAQRYGDPFFSQIGEDEFAAMTIFVGHHLAGVFYVDNAETGSGIGAATYQRFKQLITPHATVS